MRSRTIVTLATAAIQKVEGWQGHIAGWTADGQSLYAGQPMGDHLDISRFQIATRKSEPWKRIDVTRATAAWARVTPDGRSYAFVYQVTATDAFVITGLR